MDYIYLNGSLVPGARAGLSPADQGFLLGHGLFETIRVESGRPLALHLHFERFYLSASRLGLTPPPREDLESAISELLSRNEICDARLRITLTGGDSTILMTTAPLPLYAESAEVVTVPFTRNENGALSGIKSTSYGENVLALQFARERGADEAAFANTKGNLCEGSMTNIFVILGGRIVTPPLDSGCLPGTARRLVWEVCQKGEIEAEESDLPLPLPEVEFAFLTSSLRGLQPIHRFDEQNLPIHHPVFETLREAYLAALRG